MNIAEFLGLPIEHAEEFVELAAIHFKNQQRAVLEKQNIKMPESAIGGEELIKAIFRQQVLFAAKKQSQINAQKQAGVIAGKEFDEKLKG